MLYLYQCKAGENMNIKMIVKRQRAFFNSQKSKSVQTRKLYLKKLRDKIMEMEDEIHDALAADLGKSKSESYMSEIGMVLGELTYQLRHMDSLENLKRVRNTAFSMEQALNLMNLMVSH